MAYVLPYEKHQRKLLGSKINTTNIFKNASIFMFGNIDATPNLSHGSICFELKNYICVLLCLNVKILPGEDIWI